MKVDDDNTQREINFDWLKLQECDDAIKTVIDTIDNDNKPSESMIRRMPKFQRNLFQNLDKLSVQDHLLCYKDGDLPRVLVIPQSHHSIVAEKYHSHTVISTVGR